MHELEFDGFVDVILHHSLGNGELVRELEFDEGFASEI